MDRPKQSIWLSKDRDAIPPRHKNSSHTDSRFKYVIRGPEICCTFEQDNQRVARQMDKIYPGQGQFGIVDDDGNDVQNLWSLTCIVGVMEFPPCARVCRG